MATTIPGGFPDGSSTGVPAGTALTAYTGPKTITTDGTVIEGKIIDGSLRITGDNVVIKNCIITFNSWWGIDAEGAKNITVQDCDIVGPGYSGDSNAAILGSGTFLRNDISKVENGIVLMDGGSTVKGNYIHDLQDKSSDPHYDGIAVQGGQSGVLIEGNTILARDTSDIIIQNYFGPVSNIVINNNYLGGTPGYNVYVEGRFDNGTTTGVSITNNYVEKGYWGYYSIEKSSPLISGNIEFLPGRAPTDPTPSPDPDPTPTPDPTPDPVSHIFWGTRGDDMMTGSPNGASTSGFASAAVAGDVGGDILRGLGGNDTYVVDNSNDVVDESVSNSGGLDTVRSSLSINLSDTGHFKGAVESVVLTGTGNTNATGNALANILTGNSASNVLQGGAGADKIDGGSGIDTSTYAGSKAGVSISLQDHTSSGGDAAGDKLANVENLTGSNYADRLIGDGSNNVLQGGNGADIMNGRAGNDTLIGGAGLDTLYGSTGADAFVFNAPLNAANRDYIRDFSHADDTIQLENAIFTKLGTGGALNADFFHSGTAAADANDHIIYNRATGGLLYDADGNGGGAAVAIAVLTTRPGINASDFQVI